MKYRGYVRNDPYYFLLHLVEFALAITVCALYGVDVDRARRDRRYPSDEWVYAVVVGGVSATTAVLYCFAFVRWSSFAWVSHAVLCIMWAVLSGIFGQVRESFHTYTIHLFLWDPLFTLWP